ncbi:hypothetical protein WME90_08520 [Sorangium sp. So ce375]|uniref:hypothetical protein n=1 Tax=Sorangium sp. So ce375 TaxID=3133306 RepID=UPI003F5BB928
MVTIMFVAIAQTMGCAVDTGGDNDGMTGEVALDEVDEALDHETTANVSDSDTSESRSGVTPREFGFGWNDGWDRNRFPCDRDDRFHRCPCDRDDFFNRHPCDRDDFFCRHPCDRDDFFRRPPCGFPCFPCFPCCSGFGF